MEDTSGVKVGISINDCVSGTLALLSFPFSVRCYSPFVSDQMDRQSFFPLVLNSVSILIPIPVPVVCIQLSLRHIDRLPFVHHNRPNL